MILWIKILRWFIVFLYLACNDCVWGLGLFSSVLVSYYYCFSFTFIFSMRDGQSAKPNIGESEIMFGHVKSQGGEIYVSYGFLADRPTFSGPTSIIYAWWKQRLIHSYHAPDQHWYYMGCYYGFLLPPQKNVFFPSHHGLILTQNYYRESIQTYYN